MRRPRSGDGVCRWGRRGFAALAGTLALILLPSCSTDSLFGKSQPASAPSPSFGQRISSLFSGGSPQLGTTGSQSPGMPAQELDCPPVDIRPGASTYSITAATKDPSVMGLRYQGTLGQTARECANLGATMTIKVGVQGRIILGPAGAPGQLEVPLRLALVHEGPEPKTIWTKFYRFPVTIEPGQNNAPFTHVEEDLTFPTPPPGDLEYYVIYIGFDPQGLATKPEKKPRPQRKR